MKVMKIQNNANVFTRLTYALGPLAGGMLLDVMDLATLGPIGIGFGWLLGGGVAWWIGSIYGFSFDKKVILAALAAVYCSVPMTEMLPVATIVSAACRFFEEPKQDSGDSKNKVRYVDSQVMDTEGPEKTN